MTSAEFDDAWEDFAVGLGLPMENRDKYFEIVSPMSISKSQAICNNYWSFQNKVVYTAALVADSWAGAENLKKWQWRTDGPTDQWTEKWLIETRVHD